MFTYSYTIKIKNLNIHSVKLLSRRWVIEDAFENIQEVNGEGVVGMTPEIRSGESFIYSSLCPLKTPSGKMSGSYRMQAIGGQLFDVEIKQFELRNNMLVN